MPSNHPFTRSTIIAAANLLQALTNNEFDNLMLRLGIEGEVATGAALPKKVNQLAELALEGPLEVQYGGGTMSLQEAIVRKATTVYPRAQSVEDLREFRNGLKRDGFTLVKDEDGGEFVLRQMLPEIADLPAADDEVRTLLKQHNFGEPLTSLDQAINCHGRGEWEAANSQLRTFLEGLLGQVSERLVSGEAHSTKAGYSCHAGLLASLDPPFLREDLNEWRGDGKGFINGLFKLLHTAGSHPGPSDEEDSTFRLHIVLIVARLLLRRYDRRSGLSR